MNEINTQIVEEKAVKCLNNAKFIMVADNNQYIFANDYIKGLNGLLKEIDDTFDDNIKDAYALHKNLIAKKKKHSEPVIQAISIIKNKMLEYKQECEKKRRKEEMRLQAEARKKAEDEAKKLAAQAKTKEEKEAIKREVIDNTPAPVVPQIETNIKGTHVRQSFDFKILDQGKIKPEYLIPDMALMRATVKRRGIEAESMIGGIKVFIKQNMIVRK